MRLFEISMTFNFTVVHTFVDVIDCWWPILESELVLIINRTTFMLIRISYLLIDILQLDSS